MNRPPVRGAKMNDKEYQLVVSLDRARREKTLFLPRGILAEAEEKGN
jgi:hypothetical protein